MLTDSVTQPAVYINVFGEAYSQAVCVDATVQTHVIGSASKDTYVQAQARANVCTYRDTSTSIQPKEVPDPPIPSNWERSSLI